MGALRDRGVPVEVASVEEAEERIAQGSSATYWIDTLHLGRFGELADLAGQSARVCLLAHYLPSLCAARSDWTAHVLGDDERTALDRAKAVLAPSATFAETLRRVGAKGSVVVVEPGLVAGPRSSVNAEGVRAIVVAPLTRAKGVLPFLETLAVELRATDRFTLDVVGDSAPEPDCAEACWRFASTGPLSERVSFSEALPHHECLKRLAAANVFVSASVTESFGLALAEARAAGLAIVARDGGHASAHAREETGGVVVHDAARAAEECLRLSRDPDELSRRLELARQPTTVRRWAEAAEEFLKKTAFLRG
jgi:glycosyltransferase involved in cell wall biosynthesis